MVLKMIDIIVPVYNEAGNIKKLFDEIEAEVHSPKRISIVYDFDEDDTLPVVERLKESYTFEIRTIKNTVGRGVVNAIKVGMAAAEYDAILVMMADLSDKLDVVDTMLEKLQSGYDLVCGSRYMKGGKQNGGPVLKGLLSRTAGVSLHFLTGIPTHDVTNSFKMYSKRLINNIKIESNGGFEIGLEIAVKAYASGYAITEIPSEWFDRTTGESNFHMWKWMPKYLKWYLYAIIHTWFGKRDKN